MVGRGQVGLEWLGNMYGYKSSAVGIMELLNLFCILIESMLISCL